MASNTTKTFNTFAQSRLTAAITNAQLTCDLLDDPVHLFPNWVTGTEFYMTLVDASANREIVKVTAISGNQLTIARGQGGTSARAWPVGTLIEERPTKDDMAAFLQPQAFRTVAYNPNGVLTAAYPGEKIFQSYQNLWWKNVSGTVWQLIAGLLPGWYSYFDNTVWETADALKIAWNGTGWEIQAGEDEGTLNPKAATTWAEYYRPTKIRVTFTGASSIDINLDNATGTNLLPVGNFTSLQEIDISTWYNDLDIGGLNFEMDAPNGTVITNIEFYEEYSYDLEWSPGNFFRSGKTQYAFYGDIVLVDDTGSVDVYITGGKSPYTWALSGGAGFTLDAVTTTAATYGRINVKSENTVNTSGATGRCTVTVTDADGYTCSGVIIPCSWVAKFDNTKWEVDVYGDGWDGTKWVSGTSGTEERLRLSVIGGWESGYEPWMLRITCSATLSRLEQAYSGGGGLVSTTYVSLTEVDCRVDYHSQDLSTNYMKLTGSPPAFNVTNIEYYEEV